MDNILALDTLIGEKAEHVIHDVTASVGRACAFAQDLTDKLEEKVVKELAVHSMAMQNAVKAEGMAVQELVKAQGMAVKELVEAKGSALQDLVEAKVLTVNDKIDLVMLAIRAGFEQKQQDVACYKTVINTLFWLLWTGGIMVTYFVLGFYLAVVIQQGPVDPSDQQGPVDPVDQALRELVRSFNLLGVKMAPGVKSVAIFMHDIGVFKVLAFIADIMIHHE
jgi:hypothetical protein